MQTSSTTVEKSFIANGIYIECDFKKATLSDFVGNKGTGKSQAESKTAIVRDISEDQYGKKTPSLRSAYTLQEGDENRLNKNGVLRVYNLNEPLDIPVTDLLGKWRKQHVGVTLFLTNGKWCTGGKLVANEIDEQAEGSLAAFRKFIRFAMA